MFIVLEGLDGSGKALQANLLAKKLKEKGKRVESIDFPQYGKKSAGLIEEYLNGKYGLPKEIGAYRASIFYACDRYDASFLIQKWLNEDKIVIADRYIASNIGHQGGKIKSAKKWKEFLDWDYNLEFNLFKIPKPTLTFILKTSPTLAKKMSGNVTDDKKNEKKTLALSGKKQDIHEKDIIHQKETLASYLKLAKSYPKEFRVIECLENDKFKSPEAIQESIWKEIEKRI